MDVQYYSTGALGIGLRRQGNGDGVFVFGSSNYVLLILSAVEIPREAHNPRLPSLPHQTKLVET